MSEWHSLGRLAREPLYNTQAVAQATSVPKDTIRAWERRYGLPLPTRTAANQRLYSERDIGVIRWLRQRTDEGMTISQAIQRLRLEFPELFDEGRRSAAPAAPLEPAGDDRITQLRQRLIDAFIAFDAPDANRLIDEGLARCSVEAFCARFVEPVLADIGARWSSGEVTVAAEHFATRQLTTRLSSIFALVAPVGGRGTVVAACPAAEEHDLGLLVLAIVLSRRGWQVVYLGANVPTADLVMTTRAVQPDAVLLSVTTDRSLAQAVSAAEAMRAGANWLPVVVGGRAVTTPGVRRLACGAHAVAGGAVDVADDVTDLIARRPQGRADQTYA